MSLFLVVTVVLVTLLQVVIVTSAAVELRGRRRSGTLRQFDRILATSSPPRISVLMPAFNEEVTIVDAVRSSLSLTYPDVEVVVIDDGSSDRTTAELVDAYELEEVPVVYRRTLDAAPVIAMYRSRQFPNLVVARKENGGKADALNVGIDLAGGELVCAIDADTIVNNNALQLLVAPFLDRGDVVAVGGTVRLSNGGIEQGPRGPRPGLPRNVLAGCQMVEYTRAFLIGRLGWNRLGGNLIVSGAFGVFRHDALLAVGGYEEGSIGEDMDLVVRLRRRASEVGDIPGRVEFTADPVAWTEAPERIRLLRNQRDRWFRGLLDVLVRHRRMVCNPRYGSAGMLAVPYFLIVEALAPVLEAFGLILLTIGVIRGDVGAEQLAVLGAAYGVGVIVSMVTMIIDDLAFDTFSRWQDRVVLAFYVLVEAMVIRFWTIPWRLRGGIRYLVGDTTWGVQERRGFS